MFTSSAIALRRTLLTTLRTTRPAARTITTARLSTPTRTTRRFQAIHRKAYAMSAIDANDGGVHNLGKKTEWEAALSEKGLLVLDCFATWCGPCKMIAPQVVKYSKQYTDVRFYKIDVDEVPDVAQDLGVRAMPTFLLFKDGEKVDEVVGANPKAIEAAILKHQ